MSAKTQRRFRTRPRPSKMGAARYQPGSGRTPAYVGRHRA